MKLWRIFNKEDLPFGDTPHVTQQSVLSLSQVSSQPITIKDVQTHSLTVENNVFVNEDIDSVAVLKIQNQLMNAFF